MLVTIDWIAKNYSKFNKLCFNGELPNITFKINRSRTNWGFASFLFDYDNDTVIPEGITISNYYDSPEEVKIQTLLHEMIHISDYVHCPFHFIRNRRRVSARYYDAHGKWFMMEAKRVSNITGYKVTNHVTDEEFNNSKLSNKSKRIEEYRNKNALICAVVGNNSIFWFKTDVNKIDYIKSRIRTQYNWDLSIGGLKKIKFYSFNNSALASRRSCTSKLTGWRSTEKDFKSKLIKYQATEINV